MHIAGPVGKLECQIDEVISPPNNPIAVLCHPHPLYGGSMHDAVLSSTADRLLDHKISCIRFNFRGVGSSEGSHDNGIGEMADLTAITAHFSGLYPEKPVWIIGYSFGAAIAWKAMIEIKPEKALLIAPPIKHIEFGQHGLNKRVSVIAGGQDEFIDAQRLEDLEVQSLSILEEADHFFTAHHEGLSDAVDAFIESSDND